MGLENGRAGEEEGEEEAMASSGLLPLAGAFQQPYVSELLSFTLDRLHKVRLPPSPLSFRPKFWRCDCSFG